jgi:2-polyprenyl-3-methyl-5-hydroxy-6-metoxy-1,4-benzoquinol methylase
MVFRSNPERDWRRLGEIDPYYGVLSTDRFRTENLTEQAKRDFFETGVAHVELCLEILQRVFAFRPHGRALDFGCGVGRLTCAMAPFFSQVVGLDISPGMLSEARAQAQNKGLTTVTFDLSTNDRLLGPSQYDFVHSYLVLQHVPVKRGEEIVEKMIIALKADGVGAIHLTYGGYSKTRAMIKNVLVLRYLGNLLLQRAWNYPTMQMNNYGLDRIIDLLGDHKIEQFFVHRVDDFGHYGAFIFFRKVQGEEAMSPWSNPMRKTV